MSLIRDNLMTREGYSPYCGLQGKCPDRWPRTVFNDKQFVCPSCGWVSAFDKEFIKIYKEKWGLEATHMSDISV